MARRTIEVRKPRDTSSVLLMSAPAACWRRALSRIVWGRVWRTEIGPGWSALITGGRPLGLSMPVSGSA
jgi:hypothetical protein